MVQNEPLDCTGRLFGSSSHIAHEARGDAGNRLTVIIDTDVLG
jgi:hypothetical protein